MGRGDRLRAEIAARGFALATVSGTSMLPTLRPGETVRLVACGAPRPGQVVAFEQGSGLLIHRVLRATDGGVICRGDNRLGDDGFTPLAAVVGTAVEVFAADSAGGRAIADGRAALLRANAAIRGRASLGRASHVLGELVLLLRQLAGHEVFTVSPVPLSGLRDPLAETPAGAALIPAALYSGLPRGARLALVQACLDGQPPGARLAVDAVAVSPQHRLATAGAALRRLLARLGIEAGSPGDATWPSADGRRQVPLHLFTAEELAAELREAGACAGEVTALEELVTPVWRCMAQPMHQTQA